MDTKLRRFQKERALVLGAATLTLLWLAGPAYAQSATSQDRQQDRQDAQSNASQDRQSTTSQDRRADDDVTRRDVARFDQFLDNHREIAGQIRRTPSLVDDPQFLRSHPELDTYLQDHPGVKQEIGQQPSTFMRLEDEYGRDSGLRDRDAGIQDRDADARGRDNGAQDRDANLRDRDNAALDRNRGRDVNRGDAGNRDAVNFNRFLDDHREIGEQVRKDPSLLDNQKWVSNHAALQTYLQDNPGVRDQLHRNPNDFMRQTNFDNRDIAMHDAMHDHMADFGGFLGNHPDIRRDLTRDPNQVKDHAYVEKHAELNAYLNAHPDARSELMNNPHDFVHGAQQYNGSAAAGAGAGVSGRGAGTTGTGMNNHGTTATGTGTAGAAGAAGTSTGTPSPAKTPVKPEQ